MYLGHFVSSSGIKADPNKIKMVKEWPRPNTVSELRSFLVFCNYYRKFIKSYANFSGKLEYMQKIENQPTKD